MDVEVSLFDDATGPQPSHQLVLADNLALSVGQGTQDTKRARVNPHQLTIAPQFGRPGSSLKGPKLISSFSIGSG